MTRRMRSLVENLEVDTDRMRENLGMLRGVVFSQSVLLALVETGMTRDDAYRVVQDCAATAVAERREFREVLAADPRVTLDDRRLDEAFDTARVLHHASLGINALDAIAL